MQTVCRQPELGEGEKIVREVAGRKLLLTRHRGELYAMDSHCFHMGHPLVDGDLEDVADHPCVVCPAHRYRIDMKTGVKVDKDLCGNACMSKDQKQRVYDVFTDGDKIQVYIPDASPQAAQLPSDKYNYWTVQQKALDTPPRQSFGLFGTAAASQPPTPPHLEPYAGLNGIALSQSPPRDTPQQPVQQQQQPAPQQQPQRATGQAQGQGHINFRAARARAAIFANYKPPPMAEPARAASSARGLLGSQPPVQRTLQDMWGRQAVAAGPEDMEMD